MREIKRREHVNIVLSEKEAELLERIAQDWSKSEIIRFLIHFYADITNKITKEELFHGIDGEKVEETIGETEKKTIPTWVRFSKDELKVIRQIAHNLGMNTSDFIRYAVRYYILTKYLEKDCLSEEDLLKAVSLGEEV